MLELSESTVLFGADPEPHIVAVEFCEQSAACEVEIFSRAAGTTTSRKESFRPFLWTSQLTQGACPLSGGLSLDHLLEFESWQDWKKAKTRLGPEKAFGFSEPIQQYLTISGKTLFKQWEWSSLGRMQLGVVTASSSDFSHSFQDPILAIALSDHTGWEELLTATPEGNENAEREVLTRLTRIIQERDPDVIEGHRLFSWGLPYLMGRAQTLKVTLNWGRDQSVPKARKSRLQIAEKSLQIQRVSVYGRHLLDTWILAQLYDVGSRELEGLSLQTIAGHFGVSSEEMETRAEEPLESLLHAALREVREIQSIANLLGQSYFLQAQIFPMSFQDMFLRGNATRIDALFLREYFRQKHSIPCFPKSVPYEGGATAIFMTGVLENVWHCDVASLYPSLMLHFGLAPETDRLGIFTETLRALRSFRLAAKTRAKEAAPAQAQHFHAFQGVFKVLINSFYGYLGFSQGHFADFQAAAAVTSQGRELLYRMVHWLGEQGAQVIEIDTDGIYFQPPSEAEPDAMEAAMRSVLPEGISVEFDQQYRAMFSYKAKNYALLGEDDRLVLTGAALKSRGMERYLRVYLKEVIRRLLKKENAGKLRDEFAEKIVQREWPIEMLMKTETLPDSLAAYQKKISTASRNRSAVFELALRSGRNYQAGDQICFYITGAHPSVTAYQAARLVSEWNPSQRDENVAYYLAKLDELARKFAPFLNSTSPPAQSHPELPF